jgi:hypothetical protein
MGWKEAETTILMGDTQTMERRDLILLSQIQRRLRAEAEVEIEELRTRIEELEGENAKNLREALTARNLLSLQSGLYEAMKAKVQELESQLSAAKIEAAGGTKWVVVTPDSMPAVNQVVWGLWSKKPDGEIWNQEDLCFRGESGQWFDPLDNNTEWKIHPDYYAEIISPARFPTPGAPGSET